MRVTSRERVLTTFAHEEPARVPLWCGASAEFWDKAKRELQLDDEALYVRFGADFRRAFAEYPGPESPLQHESATCRPVFGSVRSGVGYGQPLAHPLPARPTVGLWLLALGRGFSRWGGSLAFGVWSALGLFVKMTYAIHLVPPALAVLIWGAWRSPTRARVLGRAAACVGMP